LMITDKLSTQVVICAPRAGVRSPRHPRSTPNPERHLVAGP
jgi:hypothetical protein